MATILEPESAIWYALCWLAVISRLVARRLHLGGWKRLQVDDYLIIVAMVTDTVLFTTMHLIINTNSNLIPPDVDPSTFSPEEITQRIYGSKLVLVIEQMQIVTVWVVKACLLLMYHRMTALLSQHFWVKVTAVYVAIGFVVMEILYLGVWCRPFHEYWAVPPKNAQCSAATNHLIVNMVFNLSSDIMIIAIPMPLIFRVRVPLQKKCILGGMFMIGTFTIIAATLNKYYSFTNPFGVEWTIWYLRESFTAILCANLPLTWPLLQRIFKLENWTRGSYGTRSRPTRQQSYTLSAFSRTAPKTKLHSTTQRSTIRRAESQEAINEDNSDKLRIYQDTVITVQMSNIGESAENGASDWNMPNSDAISLDSKTSGESEEHKTGVTTTCHAMDRPHDGARSPV